MKKLFLILSLVFLLTSCEEKINSVAKGYLVHKTHIKAHMSDQKAEEINYAGFSLGFSHPIHHPSHPLHPMNTARRHKSKQKPHKVMDEYIFYIGNKDGVIKSYVDQNIFNSYKCGDKISLVRKSNNRQ